MDTNYIVNDTEQAALSTEFGNLIKMSMEHKGLSIRGLSKLTGISTATISRIITGKQPANIFHMHKLALILNISIEKLLNSMGVSYTEHSISTHSVLLEIIQEVLEDFKIDFKAVISDIAKELEKLELYAKTLEGKKIILDGFKSKIDTIDGAGAVTDKLNMFYELFCSDNISKEKKAVIGSALLYFVLTIGVIPDYMFPIGYLDDALAVKIVEKKYLSMDD